MSFELVPSVDKEQRETIMVAGKEVGWIKATDIAHMRSIQFHAGFDFFKSGDIASTNHSLVQGFGATREEAMADAISRGRQQAHELTTAIEELDLRLGQP